MGHLLYLDYVHCHTAPSSISINCYFHLPLCAMWEKTILSVVIDSVVRIRHLLMRLVEIGGILND